MQPRAPLTDVRDIVAGRLYGTADVASLFGVSEATVQLWAREGRLPCVPRLSPNMPFRFLGQALLDKLGKAAAAVPREVESAAQRSRRAAAARERVKKLAGIR